MRPDPERMLRMENVRIEEKNAHILKIELNSQGDYVSVSADDPTLLDRFTAGARRIYELAEEIPGKLDVISGRYEGKDSFPDIMDKTAEISGVNVGFSEAAATVIDGIFGEGTLRKYFRDIYEEIPDFLPDADCIMDFLEQVIPVMEGLFGHKIERQREAGRARMARYQPQDHKKPGRMP